MKYAPVPISAKIVEGYVTLKGAGIGAYKGLCPFHDERTPSFNVRPQMGTYHCFGCGESGDVYSFVMAMEHTGFTETVERLAARIGYTLHYEGGNPRDRYEASLRRRLLDAHKIAAEFFERSLYSANAGEAQRFLGARGFDPAATKTFGVGYAPPWLGQSAQTSAFPRIYRRGTARYRYVL